MARSYEYVICGPPLASRDHAPSTLPRKTLSTKREPQRQSNLRTLFRNSASPTEFTGHLESLQEHRVSSPTTPKLPPTPPTGEDEENFEDEQRQDKQEHGQTAAAQESDLAKPIPLPITPVPQNSPPTPDDTPPRALLGLPVRPSLALRPSVASTRAESFRTAREHLYSEDESEHISPELRSAFASPVAIPRLPVLSRARAHDGVTDGIVELETHDTQAGPDEDLPSSVILPLNAKEHHGENALVAAKDTPETQFRFDHLLDHPLPLPETPPGKEQGKDIDSIPARISSIHARVTVLTEEAPMRGKSLRDRLQDTKKVHDSRSTEAFANVIGWNDGGVRRDTDANTNNITNRLSYQSNPSAVEAYVVESPIRPRKRGTLRKVVKNDSLRSASSPIPQSHRDSMQSNSDSLHRLVHKKQKLGNEHRRSVGSEISNSRRSLSWGSGPVGWLKPDVVKVAVIPERESSLHTSASSSREHSRSISESLGQKRPPPSMPAFTTPTPRHKRALHDLNAKGTTAMTGGPPQVLIRTTSLSAPTSRNTSRANSIRSEQFSMQREQAEKDLRTTLERMETERLSASLRRSSNQSSSPTPAPRHIQVEQAPVPDLFPARMAGDTYVSRKLSSTAESTKSRQKSVTIDASGITPGTKEWADLRPSTLTGTPFSQASMLSTSPEIIEARAVNFFPHNKKSLQLIEPNRLSESPAVRALRDQSDNMKRANTLPARPSNTNISITTPRMSDQLLTAEHSIIVDSPLRNPRKPPEPPQVQFKFIPPTPQSELNHQLGATPDTSPVKSRHGTALQQRPSLRGRDRSESFIKSLTRNMSLRNAKNPKADQELDSTLHPFWRPRAFWDDEDYRRRVAQDQEREESAYDADIAADRGDTDVPNAGPLTISNGTTRLDRSNTITTGPVSLMRRISERRRQRRIIDEHLAGQQALVTKGSFSSLQKIRAGRRLYGLPPIRSLSLNMGIGRLGSLKEKLVSARSRREDEKREERREKLRRSIGAGVVSQGDSRFPKDIQSLGGGRVNSQEMLSEMLEEARAERLVQQKGLRM